MTYDGREASVRNGAPYEMYAFVRNGTQYNYTSADQAHSTIDHTYAAALISRGPITRGQDRRVALEVTVPRDNPIAELLDASGVPLDPITLTLKRNHVGEDDTAAVTLFAGQVMGAKWVGDSVTLSCETPEALLDKPGLRLPVQRSCPFMLYDDHCLAASASFLFESTVTAVDGAVITVDGLSDEAGSDKSRFIGGFIKRRPVSGTYAYGGSIIAQDGSDRITLALPNADIAVDDEIQVFPGCDKSVTTCANRFSNEEHFGGFPGLPVRNPFTGAGLNGDLR